MHKVSLYLLLMVLVAVVASCGRSERGEHEPFTAREFVPDTAITECDSAINAYVTAVGNDYTFQGLKQIFEEYIAKYPTSTTLQRSFQDLYYRYEMADEMIEHFRSLHESKPNVAMYAYLYGRASEDPTDRMELFRKAAELDPDYFWGWYGLAATLTFEPFADTLGAIESYKKAIAVDNAQPSGFRYIGELYEGLGILDTALIYYGLLSQTRPDDIVSLSPKIDVLKKMGKFRDAEDELNSFLMNHPDDYYARMELVDLFEDQGRYVDAIPYLRRLTATANRPNDAYHRLMVMYCKLGIPDSALQALNSGLAGGFDDYRTVLHDPKLSSMRQLAEFAKTREVIQDSIESGYVRREEERRIDRAKRRQEALTEMLEVPAPEFTLVDLHGDTVSLSALAGNVVILDFWATWCGPCRLTMPLMQEFHDARKKDMRYYAINVWEQDTTAVRPYLSKYGYTFNVLFGAAETASEYGVAGIPALFMIDRHGVIRFRHGGYRPDLDEVLGWQLDELLKSE